MVRKQRIINHLVGACFAWACLLIPCNALFADDSPSQPPPADAENGKVLLDGKHIESLQLRNNAGKETIISKPGNSISLPAGRYTIEEIKLQGDCWSLSPYRCRDADRVLIVTAGESCRPDFGPPLQSNITAKRYGRVLELNYTLSDADGWKYTLVGGDNPPRFDVYQGDTLIGSGSFEYG